MRKPRFSGGLAFCILQLHFGNNAWPSSRHVPAQGPASPGQTLIPLLHYLPSLPCHLQPCFVCQLSKSTGHMSNWLTGLHGHEPAYSTSPIFFPTRHLCAHTLPSPLQTSGSCIAGGSYTACHAWSQRQHARGEHARILGPHERPTGASRARAPAGDKNQVRCPSEAAGRASPCMACSPQPLPCFIHSLRKWQGIFATMPMPIMVSLHAEKSHSPEGRKAKHRDG